MNGDELEPGSQEAADWVQAQGQPTRLSLQSQHELDRVLGRAITFLPGALGDFSHSPWCLEEEMETGWNWESVHRPGFPE